jgi:hypothetical protein
LPDAAIFAKGKETTLFFIFSSMLNNAPFS